MFIIKIHTALRCSHVFILEIGPLRVGALGTRAALWLEESSHVKKDVALCQCGQCISQSYC